MDHSETIHPIFLHLPLNIFWRIAGWNRIINKVLMKEHFWKEKCEREFELMPLDPFGGLKIDNYRLYYMIKSKNIKGNLYILDDPNNERPIIRNISYIHGNTSFVNLNCFVVKNGKFSQITKLHQGDKYSIRDIIDEGVKYVAYKGSVGSGSLYWIKKMNGEDLIIDVFKDEGSINKNAYYIRFPIESPIPIVDWNRIPYWGKSALAYGYLVLTRDRRLTLHSDGDRSSRMLREGVIAYLLPEVLPYKEVIVSFEYGFIEVMSVTGESKLRVHHPHLQIILIDKYVVIQTLDGTMEFYQKSDIGNFDKPVRTVKLSVPIRDWYSLSEGSLVTTVDGRARILDSRIGGLISTPPELKYEGVAQYHHRCIIANKVNKPDMLSY